MIKIIAEHYLHPLLKSYGFRKRGLGWNRKKGNFVNVITLQKAKHSTSTSQEVTGNVGIFIPEFYYAVYGRNVDFVSEAECPVRVRFGEIILDNYSGETLDQWWNVNSSSVETVAEDFINLVEQKVIPFFDSIYDYFTIEKYLSQVGSWKRKMPYIQLCTALVYWKNGKLSSFNDILSSVDSNWADKIENVRKWIEQEVSKTD